MTNQKQRLELTWIGKDERPRLEPRILIEDPEKSYHANERVSENDIFDNRLIFGDNLLALKALEQDFLGKFKCIYIDPPFNTQQAFDHYEDGLEHSVWLQMMRDRIYILHRLLSPDGSLFIQIDDNELGYLLALTDEIFDRKNRISVITFKQSAASGPKSINPGLVSTSNFVLYYAKDRRHWSPNRVYVPIPRDARYNNFILNVTEPYEKWRIGTLRSAFAQAHGLSVGDIEPHFGSKTEQKITEFVIENRNSVVQPALIRPEDINAEARGALEASGRDRDKVFKSQREERYFINGKQILFYRSKTRVIDGVLQTAGLCTTIWDDLFSNNIHKEGGVSFPNGKKPEALIKRILEIATSPGELVLDSFAGCGTTGAVAHKMGRGWIMVELGEHCHTHIVPRLKKVINGADPGGITEAVGWKGGGGFRYYRLAPSLLERDRWGNWVISREFNAAMLSEAVCKLTGFVYSPSEQHYWMHGRSSERDFIYVTTQSLTHDQLRAVAEDVGPERTLLICCKAFHANVDAFENLTVKKIPQSVMQRCEWGRDDYSLSVANLALASETASPPDGEVEAEPLTSEPPKRRGRPQKSAQQPSLFASEEE